MLEKIERFFVLYLNKNKLKYTLADDIYKVKTDSKHKKWWGTEELVCTFNSSKKGVMQMGMGNVVLDSMLTQFMDTHVKASLFQAEHPEFLEHLSPPIEPVRLDAVFMYVDIAAKTAKQNINEKKKFLQVGTKIKEVKDVQLLHMSIKKDPVEQHILPKIEQMYSDKLSARHIQEKKELMEIQESHSDAQFKEVQAEERRLELQIEELKEQQISAPTFEVQDSIRLKISRIRQRLENIKESNESKRQDIKELFGEQKASIERRELKLKVIPRVILRLSLPAYKVKKGLYVPFIRDFF